MEGRGGTLVAWNPTVVVFKPSYTCAKILLSGSCKGFSQEINVLNIYGPCHDHRQFWDFLHSCGWLNAPDLILVGDLNFTLTPSKVWGAG